MVYVNLLDCTVLFLEKRNLLLHRFHRLHPGTEQRSKIEFSRKTFIAPTWRWWTHLATGCSSRLFLFSSFFSSCDVHRINWNLKTSVYFLLQGLDLLSCIRRPQCEELLHNRVEAAPIRLRRTAASSCFSCLQAPDFFFQSICCHPTVARLLRQLQDACLSFIDFMSDLSHLFITRTGVLEIILLLILQTLRLLRSLLHPLMFRQKLVPLRLNLVLVWRWPSRQGDRKA